MADTYMTIPDYNHPSSPYYIASQCQEDFVCDCCGEITEKEGFAFDEDVRVCTECVDQAKEYGEDLNDLIELARTHKKI